MNWSDWMVVGIIAVFGIIGLVNGFIYSIFRLASFFVSSYVAIKFYPVVAKILMKTVIFEKIKSSIYDNLLMKQQSQVAGIDAQAKTAAADMVVNNLQLPDFLKGTLIDQMPNPSKLLNMNQIVDVVSSELASMVINILSLLILYILVRIILVFLRFILSGIAKLPIFKQMDKLGGFAFGALEGLLTIYIVFAVLMLFNTAPQFKSFFEAIHNSSVAKFFYENNFIVNWMFLKGTKI